MVACPPAPLPWPGAALLESAEGGASCSGADLAHLEGPGL